MKSVNKFRSKVEKKIKDGFKKIYHSTLPHSKQKQLLFITGCQRSGTTLMLDVFRNDFNVKTYSEFSKLSSEGLDKIRLNPLPSVESEILKDKAPIIVLKPLVESQNIIDLLQYFQDSKAIWMYRDFKDVASSDLVKFGEKNGIFNLKPIVKNELRNWRSEGASENVKKIILKHYSEDMNYYDAAVLFWYIRNILFFELNLDNNSNIILIKYEDLTSNPEKVFRQIYKKIDQDYPGNKIHKEVHSNSVKKGKNIKLSPEINELANILLEKLDNIYND